MVSSTVVGLSRPCRERTGQRPELNVGSAISISVVAWLNVLCKAFCLARRQSSVESSVRNLVDLFEDLGPVAIDAQGVEENPPVIPIELLRVATKQFRD